MVEAGVKKAQKLSHRLLLEHWSSLAVGERGSSGWFTLTAVK